MKIDQIKTRFSSKNYIFWPRLAAKRQCALLDIMIIEVISEESEAGN